MSILIAQVTESIVKFNLGEHNALQLKLNDVNKNMVEREWKLYTKSHGKPDKKKVDWYMRLDKNKKNVILKLCVISNEEFLSSSNQSGNYRIIENYLSNFVFVVEKAKVKNEFESENKTLTKLQKKLKKLSENYNSNLKSIDKYNKRIKSAEKDNKSNLKKQADTRENIFNQGLIVEGILSNPSDSIQVGEVSPEYEDANKELLKMQKKLNKLTGDYEDNLKKIDKSIKKINKVEKDNKSNLKDQTKTKKQITEQGQLVEKLRKRFESMR
jgi:DNA-binding ferritin-like protein (Dps family)